MLGALGHIETLLQKPLYAHFDLIVGAGVGAAIGSLLALGGMVDEIETAYRAHLAPVMAAGSAEARANRLSAATRKVFAGRSFADMKTPMAIVATRVASGQPHLFLSHRLGGEAGEQTHVPGDGVGLADAVIASCSAHPVFRSKFVKSASGEILELIDGGFCANNPSLLAIAQAKAAGIGPQSRMRVVAIGGGAFGQLKPAPLSRAWIAKHFMAAELVQRAFEINTQTVEHLLPTLFPDVPIVRIGQRHRERTMGMFEHRPALIPGLRSRGEAACVAGSDLLREALFA